MVTGSCVREDGRGVQTPRHIAQAGEFLQACVKPSCTQRSTLCRRRRKGFGKERGVGDTFGEVTGGTVGSHGRDEPGLAGVQCVEESGNCQLEERLCVWEVESLSFWVSFFFSLTKNQRRGGRGHLKVLREIYEVGGGREWIQSRMMVWDSSPQCRTLLI